LLIQKEEGTDQGKDREEIQEMNLGNLRNKIKIYAKPNRKSSASIKRLRKT